MTTWTYKHKDGFVAVVTADNIELAKILLTEKLKESNMFYVNVKNEDLIPLPTHHRYIRCFEVWYDGSIK